MLIVLAGPRKSGKTTLARLIAEAAGKHLVSVQLRDDLPLDDPSLAYLYDNVRPTAVDLRWLKTAARVSLVIVTTDAPLPDFSTPVFHLSPIDRTNSSLSAGEVWRELVTP